MRFGRKPHILLKTNAVSPKGDLIWAKMYYIFMCSRQLSSGCYHKRFDVGSVFSMVKGRFRDLVRSKSDGGRPNRVLAKGVCHRGWAPVRAADDPGIEPPARAGSGDGPKHSNWRTFWCKTLTKP